MKLWEKIKECNKLECGENCVSCQYKMVCWKGRQKTKQKIDRKVFLGALVGSSIYFIAGIVMSILVISDGWILAGFITWNFFLCFMIALLAYTNGLIPRIAKKYNISGLYCDSDGCISLDGDNVTIRVGEIEVRK